MFEDVLQGFQSLRSHAPTSPHITKLSHKNFIASQIQYWDDVADVVLEAERRGEDVLSSGWNEYGHKLIALQLAKHLKEAALFTASH